MRHGERMVTLADGRQVSNWSDDWRHECEARAVLDMPTLAMRQAYLYGVTEDVQVGFKWTRKTTSRGVLQRRGPEAVSRLEDTMLMLWDLRKQQRLAA